MPLSRGGIAHSFLPTSVQVIMRVEPGSLVRGARKVHSETAMRMQCPVAGCWLLLFVLHAGPVAAVTRHVPAEVSTIQAAVSASGQGDTVLVGPGTYRENIVITRDVWLRSAGGPAVTVIDGSSPSHPDSASVVAIVSPELSAITGGGIEGFDIRNGSGTGRWGVFYGGGIFVQWTGAPGPLIRNNWILGMS